MRGLDPLVAQKRSRDPTLQRKAMRAVATNQREGEPAKAEPRFGGGGRRLSEAFDRVSSLPALAEARVRLLDATGSPGASVGTLTEVVESDTALTIAVMRAAN